MKKLKIQFLTSKLGSRYSLQFSLKVLILLALLVPAVSLIGYFITFSGILNESKHKSQLRTGLILENKSLARRLDSIEKDFQNQKDNVEDLKKVHAKTFGLSFYRKLGMESDDEDNIHFSLSDFFSDPKKNKNPFDLALHLDHFLQVSTNLLNTNKAKIRQLPVTIPVDRECMVTRLFGAAWDPFSEKRGFHAGIDFSCQKNLDVYAPASGTVVEVDEDPFYGLYIKMRHAGNSETFFAHLSREYVEMGSWVTKGKRIGKMGESGQSTGVHLHYELSISGEKKDPMKYYITPPRLAHYLKGQ